jgi:hypothetical protein
MSSEAEDAVVKSPRPLACDFRRLRFSRNARFSRSWRRSLAGLPGGPSRLSLPSFIVDPFECVRGRVSYQSETRPMDENLMDENPTLAFLPPKWSNSRSWSGRSRRWPHRGKCGTGSARNGASRSRPQALQADCSAFDGIPAGSRLRRWGPCGKDRRALSGPFLADSRIGACCRSSVVEHSIGNGEVDSSILSGSTTFANEINIYGHVNLLRGA